MAGPRPGEVLNDRYELIDRIGGGSMGEVWRSRDLVLGRTVAVKIVLPALLDTPTFRARFVAEARVMAMMDHPGIVRVYDYGYTDATDPDTPGAAFLVMEFIEGESLDRVLARTGALEPRFALKVLASLLDALGAVHRTGVVHRDVKPANVMLTSGGVVLADFGIARSPESLGLTAADALMGTVPYLAPELFHAETPTPAADVYAVGILGYELLSGRQPFQAASTAAVMYMHMHEPPPPLPEYVSAPAAEVLWHALEKDPAHRWADGAEMAEAVRHVLDGPVEAGEDLADAPGPGGGHGGHAGTPSGYEDTLTDSGGRRRRRPAGEGAGYAAAAGYTEGLYGDAVQDGRYGRDAAFGESAASGFGSPHGHGHGGVRGRISALVRPRRRPGRDRSAQRDAPGRHPRLRRANSPDPRLRRPRRPRRRLPGGNPGLRPPQRDDRLRRGAPRGSADPPRRRRSAGAPPRRRLPPERAHRLRRERPRPGSAARGAPQGAHHRGGRRAGDARAVRGAGDELVREVAGRGVPGAGTGAADRRADRGHRDGRPGAADRAAAHVDQRLRAHGSAPHVHHLPDVQPHVGLRVVEFGDRSDDQRQPCGTAHGQRLGLELQPARHADVDEFVPGGDLAAVLAVVAPLVQPQLSRAHSRQTASGPRVNLTRGPSSADVRCGRLSACTAWRPAA